jgi:UDP-N-acetylmuramoyl-tripeptide--D-alanyl-D-alanine ligase
MEALRLEQVALWCGGKLARGDPRAMVLRVVTDSRQARVGDCFVALRGERFDGHEFLAQVARANAVAAIVRRGCVAPSGNLLLIEVDDTLAALQRLASRYRDSMKLKAVAITGSNGKTTTKDLCASVLARRFSVAKTAGNLNNHIGLPLSLLGADATHEIGVFEVGMNHPGEIAALAALVKPDVAVITNIGRAHIGFFENRAAIAREKGALLASLGERGVAVLNADDDWSATMRTRCRGKVLTTGIRRAADIRACAVAIGATAQFTLFVRDTGEKALVRLPWLGKHQIYNALQAAAVGRIFGMKLQDIVAGLEQCVAPEMRMQLERIGGVSVFNDAYNANPESVDAALAAFRHVSAAGRKIAVLGEMLELGGHAEEAHAEVGAAVVKYGQIKMLITVGARARLIAEAARSKGLSDALVVSFDTAEEAAQFLKVEVRQGDCILLKGSRKVGLERVANVLREHASRLAIANAKAAAGLAAAHG